jgi:putative transcriptional regulator
VRERQKRPSGNLFCVSLVAALLLVLEPAARAQSDGMGNLEVGQFLVASRGLLDPNFAKTVVLLVVHNEEGAMGVVINRPTEVKLGQVIDDLEGIEDRPETVWVGGPVAHWQLVLLFRAGLELDEDEPILEDVYFSASRNVLESLLEAEMEFRVFAGYAGWSPGQLEQEIARGGWHVLPGDPEMIFDQEPFTLWQELVTRGEARWVSLPGSARYALMRQPVSSTAPR